MNAALTPQDRDRLVKVLALLGSDKSGERDAAACMAARMLRDRGLDWGDIVLAPQPVPMRTNRPPTTPAASYATWTNYLLRNADFLTEWERGLVMSTATRGRLTAKQVAALSQIYLRVVAQEARS